MNGRMEVSPYLLPCPPKVHLHGHLGLPLGQWHAFPRFHPLDELSCSPDLRARVSEPEGGQGNNFWLSAQVPTFQS